MSDAQTCRLIGTTKPTIAAVRERTHWNAANIKTRNPVLLGLCTQRELEEALALAIRRGGTPLPPQEQEEGYGEDEQESSYSGRDDD